MLGLAFEIHVLELRFQGLDGFKGYGGQGGHLPLLVDRYSGMDYHSSKPFAVFVVSSLPITLSDIVTTVFIFHSESLAQHLVNGL